MIRQIDVNYCRACGQLERVRSAWDLEKQKHIVEVGCDCGAGDFRSTELDMNELYELSVEVKGEEDHADSGSGDV